MINMMMSSLKYAWHSKDVNQNKDRLPRVIICFRDGVCHNDLQELYSKEICGIKKGIKQFKDEYKLNESWNPKLEYLIIDNMILDRIFKTPHFSNPKHPVVIYNGITSHRLCDFIIFNYFPSKDDGKINLVKYSCLLDELELFENNSCFELFQYIYSLGFTYPFSIPFPTGGTNYIAPIKYCKHYGESLMQMITKDDKNVIDLSYHIWNIGDILSN